MPPLSPAPGWASGDVCIEKTATRRTGIGTGGYPSTVARCLWPFRASARFGVSIGVIGVLGLERPIDLDQDLFLSVADRGVADDRCREIGQLTSRALVEYSCTHVQR